MIIAVGCCLTLGALLAGLEIAGLSESAREMRGDHFDHIPLPGSRVVLVIAEGVTEGADALGELWGEERQGAALERLRELPCQGLARSLVREVRAFEDETGPADDITVR